MRRLARRAAEVPIIVLTATDDEFLATQAVQEGARVYAPKSAATAQLLELLLRETLRDSGDRSG